MSVSYLKTMLDASSLIVYAEAMKDSSLSFSGSGVAVLTAGTILSLPGAIRFLTVPLCCWTGDIAEGSTNGVLHRKLVFRRNCYDLEFGTVH